MRTILWLSVAFVATSLAAQERLRVQGPTPATVVLGSSARVDLVVEGRGGNPDVPQPPKVAGLDIRVAGPSRQSFTSITPQGMVEQVTTTYQLVLTPQREGTFTVPAFPLRTGSREQTVAAMQLTAVKELRGAEYGYLQVRLEKQRVYVHEPVRVRVEFGVDKALRAVQDVAQDRTRYVDFEVQAPWISQLEGAEPITEEAAAGESVPVVLNRTLQTAEYDSSVPRGNQTFHSFAFQKSFLPTRPGKWTLDAPMLRYHVQLTEGRQTMFGERVGAQTQNFYVYGQPLALEVLPIPEAGRPQPYYGAVGRFAMKATLDRDTVKVGNSVKLTLEITGSGNFEFCRVPDVSSWEQKGLHLLGQTEQRKADRLAVTYDFTPTSADVKEMPSLAWNWFDTTPGAEQFVEAKTAAMPLVVEPLAAGEALAALPEAAKKTVTPGVDDIFDLAEPVGEPMRAVPLPAMWAWIAALSPWALFAFVAAFVAARKRRLADPGRIRAAAAARTFARAVEGGGDAAAALLDYLADRMGVNQASLVGADLAERLRQHGLDDALAREVAQAVERGTAARYGGGASLAADEARALVAKLERSDLRRAAAASSLARSWWVAFVVCFGSAAQAQSEVGFEAWRAGDYAKAEAAFETALETEDDRRLHFALGNCRYRLGDFAGARHAYECARLGMPRDPELLANLALVKRKLELDDGGEPFLAAVAALRDRFSPRELAWICFVLMAASALCFACSQKQRALRWVAWTLLVHGAVVAVEIVWLSPSRPQRAIALSTIELTAEPRAGMAAVATVAAGAELALRSGSAGDFVRVVAGDRSGYAPRDKVGVVQ